MPVDTYKVLGRNTDPRKCGMLEWLCPGCQRSVSKIMLLLQNIVTTQGKNEDKLRNIEENITDLYKNVDKCNEAIVSTDNLNDMTDNDMLDNDMLKSEVVKEL
eukprot:gene2241-2555_t